MAHQAVEMGLIGIAGYDPPYSELFNPHRRRREAGSSVSGSNLPRDGRKRFAVSNYFGAGALVAAESFGRSPYRRASAGSI